MKLKITTLLHRVVASYLRALTAGMSGLGVMHGATSAVHGALLPQLGAVAVGALAAPGLVALTEAANIVDPQP